jgi:hypothetical protein
LHWSFSISIKTLLLIIDPLLDASITEPLQLQTEKFISSECNAVCIKVVLTAVLNLWSADPWGSATPTQGVCDCLFNIFSQQSNKAFLRKKAKSEIENFKTLCKTKGI